MDLEDLDYVLDSLKLLGSKGTTGTQASFLELFEGDQETIDKIDPMIAAKMGFKDCYPVSGQTYSRKVDTRAVSYTHLCAGYFEYGVDLCIDHSAECDSGSIFPDICIGAWYLL